MKAAQAEGRACDGVVGVQPQDDSGRHIQHLVGVYRTEALCALVAPGGVGLRDVSVHRTLGRLNLGHVDLAQESGLDRAVQDLDTWEQVRQWESEGQ